MSITLPKALARITDDPHAIPPGYGFLPLTPQQYADRADSLNLFYLWEPPRAREGHVYVVSADVADGLGLDRSVVDVHRVGTIQEPSEQVAQYISDNITPSQLAYVIDAIGHYYADKDGYEAIAAIETNNHGLSTQDTLQLHLGYRHFYIWEVADAADPTKRQTPRIGWYTTPRTRPMMLDHFYAAVTVRDPITNKPDLVLNSAHTLAEMADLQTETTLGMAEAARGAYDDCVMAGAIGAYVAWRLAAGEQEPIADRRRRYHEQQRRREVAYSQPDLLRADFRNLPYTESELKDVVYEQDATAASLQEEQDQLLDIRGVVYDGRYYDDEG